ncbi:MAG: hypothetical protein JKY56_20825 [Kofleriaceae bacterium]|nr:hypothetical protein [Kofleriaceae bacterium]
MAPKKKTVPKKKAAPKKKSGSKKSDPQVSTSDLPRITLDDALQIPRIIHGNYAGKTASWDELAKGLGLGASNSRTKYLIWGACAYGVAEKLEDKEYRLTETGRKIVAPTFSGEESEGRRKAVLTPRILSQFFSDYNGHPLPNEQHFPNVLESKYGVPRKRTEEAEKLIRENGKSAGVIVEQAGQPPSIRLEGLSAAPPTSIEDGETEEGAEGGSREDGQDAGEAVDWSNICFYITPIGSESTDVRKHADMMLKHVLEPAAEAMKLKVVRADKIAKTGLINKQIFEQLARARLCVADLSFSNPNAFYELGVRHMCKMPTIQMIRKGDKIPFDVSQGRTITVDTSDAYTITDRLESAQRELQEQMRNVLSDNADKGDNPVDVYLPGLKVTIPEA